ncbi:MAG: PSD1 domain-containing protein [Planctomycetaceae bacterium]|nr:PSD1 domain-containing protein [Planctomycetaceae bacterium]
MKQTLIAISLCLAVKLCLTVETVVAVEVTPPASTRFADGHAQEIPDFQRHIVPLLGRLGCNSAKCHGSFQGQGGFQLSLFGFDFRSDQAAMHDAASSADVSRINQRDPGKSLLVQKPTLQTEHEGGQRFAEGSWEHRLLLRWIESGGHGASRIDAKTNETEPQESGTSKPEQAAFFNQSIKPLLEDHCYECHGFNSRKGGLSLTNREALLSGGDTGPALVPGNPEASLLIEAVRYSVNELQMPPSGRLSESEIAALEKWVRMGASWPDGDNIAPGETDLVLVSLHTEPAEILLQETDQTQQIQVIAEWDNGIREDVTCLTRFQTNNDAVATINQDGLVKSAGAGDTHVIAFYDNGVAAIPVLRPYGSQGDRSVEQPSRVKPSHPIDQFVSAKLDKLGLVPSHICSDAEFLRRVSIDMTGTLPAPAEVRMFLTDNSEEKRDRKIDELLQRPTYAAWWTNKLCDFTGCNPKSIASLLEVAREDGYVKASEWYSWIYDRVARNDPYDKIVEGIMLADLSGRDGGMPYFWTRQSLKEPKDTAMSVAHAFLGIQLQCAECHKHPFDQWTQADFSEFAQFFDSVTRTKRTSSVDGEQELRLLRSHVVQMKPGDDPRRPLMEWLRDPENPWFARALVNRVWAGYFNVGIVDPPDQFTPANPPSNPQLLDWLTRGFIDSGYDMKWLHRQIATCETYQRSWKPNETNRQDQRNFSRAIPRRIPAEVVYDALKQATAASDQHDAVRTNLQRRASGHLSMRMAGTHAMKVFGKPDRSVNCDCERVNEPTLLQAIFTQNDPLLRMRIADSGWIIEIEDAELEGKPVDQKALIDEVWIRTVGRFPTSTQRQRADQHLAGSDTIAEGIADLMWAMLNTKEFLLNH